MNERAAYCLGKQEKMHDRWSGDEYAGKIGCKPRALAEVSIAASMETY